MATKNPTRIISSAVALYPRLNQTYKYDQSAGDNGRSVPCPATDEGAEYTLGVAMLKAEAVPLYKEMKATYDAAKAKSWKAFPKADVVFEKHTDFERFEGEEALAPFVAAAKTDGEFYIARTKKKGAYSGEATKPPQQFDADNNELPEDFMLTTNSGVNVLVSLIPYNTTTTSGSGVTLRLAQVQVTHLAEMKSRSAFEVVDGGYTAGKTAGFGEAANDDGDGFEDEPAPVKSAPKAVSAPKAKPQSVENYNNIDDALDNLEFDEAS